MKGERKGRSWHDSLHCNPTAKFSYSNSVLGGRSILSDYGTPP